MSHQNGQSAGTVASRERGGANIPDGLPEGKTVPSTLSDLGLTRRIIGKLVKEGQSAGKVASPTVFRGNQYVLDPTQEVGSTPATLSDLGLTRRIIGKLVKDGQSAGTVASQGDYKQWSKSECTPREHSTPTPLSDLGLPLFPKVAKEWQKMSYQSKRG